MSLVNVLLKLRSLNMDFTLIFLLKKHVCSSAFATATHIFFFFFFFFFSKNTSELDIVLTRTVNILTTNELVQLTMLYRTGPWTSLHVSLLIAKDFIGER